MTLDLAGKGMTSQRTRNRLVQRLAEHGITDASVLDQIGAVPRHLFVDEALAHRAYEDTALPIGHGQTISQPFIVALMTQLVLEVQPKTVLDVGTGCGYQAAVLAGLVKKVCTIERIEALSTRARQRFRELKLHNVRATVGDGFAGWPQEGPYDAILVGAAPREVPPALLEQLAPGGRLVIPVGEAHQQLRIIDRTDDGLVQSESEYVRFVPMLPGTQKAPAGR